MSNIKFEQRYAKKLGFRFEYSTLETLKNQDPEFQGDLRDFQKEGDRLKTNNSARSLQLQENGTMFPESGILCVFKMIPLLLIILFPQCFETGGGLIITSI